MKNIIATARYAFGVRFFEPGFGRALPSASPLREVGRFSALYRILLCCLAFGLAAPLATAADEGPLKIDLVVLKPVAEEGGAVSEILVEGDQAGPGETLIYRATYANRGEATLRQVTGTVPVPTGLVYVPGSALPPAAEASVDGQVFFPVDAPPEGAPPAAWRFLRWSPRDLAPAADFKVELRAVVAEPAF